MRVHVGLIFLVASLLEPTTPTQWSSYDAAATAWECSAASAARWSVLALEAMKDPDIPMRHRRAHGDRNPLIQNSSNNCAHTAALSIGRLGKANHAL